MCLGMEVSKLCCSVRTGPRTRAWTSIITSEAWNPCRPYPKHLKNQNTLNSTHKPQTTPNIWPLPVSSQDHVGSRASGLVFRNFELRETYKEPSIQGPLTNTILNNPIFPTSATGPVVGSSYKECISILCCGTCHLWSFTQ